MLLLQEMLELVRDVSRKMGDISGLCDLLMSDTDGLPEAREVRTVTQGGGHLQERSVTRRRLLQARGELVAYGAAGPNSALCWSCHDTFSRFLSFCLFCMALHKAKRGYWVFVPNNHEEPVVNSVSLPNVLLYNCAGFT